MPTPPRSGLDELEALTVELADGLSASRRWQYRMVIRELRLATERDDFPAGPGATLDELLAPATLALYLDLAQRGELRADPADRGRPTSTGTVITRIRTLGPLAAAAGHPIDPGQPPAYQPRTTVPSSQREILRSFLMARTDQHQDDPYRIRVMAMVGIVLDTGAAAASLAAMRLENFNTTTTAVRIERLPQGRSLAPSDWSTHRLRIGTQAAVKRWLAERQRWVQPLHGHSTAVWVSLFPNHTGQAGAASSPRPAGMPLQAKGIQRAYRNVIHEINVEMAGRPGWTPMPTTLEELRRGVADDRRARAEARQHRGEAPAR